MIRFISRIESFDLENRKTIINWLKEIAKLEKKELGKIKYIFVSDKEITSLNNKFLEHNYSTDVIAFDNSFMNVISGEIFISTDSIRENSKEYKCSFHDELHRVVLHGLLHLIGYSDNDPLKKEVMRDIENKYLKLLPGY